MTSNPANDLIKINFFGDLERLLHLICDLQDPYILKELYRKSGIDGIVEMEDLSSAISSVHDLLIFDSGADVLGENPKLFADIKTMVTSEMERYAQIVEDINMRELMSDIYRLLLTIAEMRNQIKEFNDILDEECFFASNMRTIKNLAESYYNNVTQAA